MKPASGQVGCDVSQLLTDSRGIGRIDLRDEQDVGRRLTPARHESCTMGGTLCQEWWSGTSMGSMMTQGGDPVRAPPCVEPRTGCYRPPTIFQFRLLTLFGLKKYDPVTTKPLSVHSATQPDVMWRQSIFGTPLPSISLAP